MLSGRVAQLDVRPRSFSSVALSLEYEVRMRLSLRVARRDGTEVALDSRAMSELPPNKQTELAVAARKQVELAGSRAGGAVVAVVCSPQIRMWVRRMIEPMLPQTPVLALNEIVRGFEIQAHGVVNFEREHSDVSRPVHA